ncbi:flagellar export protein FliJ [Gottschalkia purinilytica]|uniref:Flagellar FliJ protein n=1 Tax=Gottschalkia purinilytica TaxID=1503 RepID=A0A0L0WBB7_GOTPU|nr:flagellar export protein FliJ [Gottschalkia purinilytica]KNF08814.1 flagellar export protein FliJ [Gottschalkia purinilytica]
MVKFNFRLEKVLEYKQTVEDIKKSEYGKVKQQLETEKDKLEKIVSYKETMKRKRDELVQRKTTVNELKIYNSFLNDITTKIIAQSDVVERTEENVNIARDKLVESTKEKKILQNLKSRDFDIYQYDLKREEDKLNDQFVSYSSSTNIVGE